MSDELQALYFARKSELSRLLYEANENSISDISDSIESLLHQLAGVAAAFGEGALGEQAAQLEGRLRKSVSAAEKWGVIREARALLDGPAE